MRAQVILKRHPIKNRNRDLYAAYLKRINVFKYRILKVLLMISNGIFLEMCGLYYQTFIYSPETNKNYNCSLVQF